MNKLKISELPTLLDTELSKDEAIEIIKERAEKISRLLQQLYAQKKYSMLIILQGMDGSGKDGALKKVFTKTPPFVLNNYSFKKPTKQEFAHDFLWRVHKKCPGKGEVMIFNRSHYEDILIQYVHKWIGPEVRKQRMQHINNFERMLQEGANTVILKFYLNISYEQQEIELQQRIDEYDKHWKHNPGDWEERKHWDDYMEAYEYILNHSDIPWHVLPVDKRYHRDLVLSEVLLEALENLDLEWPRLPEEN